MTEHFHVQREALRKAGGAFHDSATKLGTQTGRIGKAGIAPEVFTGPGEVMATAYEKARADLYTIAKAATEVVESVNTALVAVANNYKTVEDDVADAISKGIPTN